MDNHPIPHVRIQNVPDLEKEGIETIAIISPEEVR
jgi:hypothetical protein